MSEKEKMAEELMKNAVKNINAKPGVLKSWGKTFQMFFTDIQVGYVFKIGMDGKVEKVDKVNKKAKAAVSSIFDTPATMKALNEGGDPMEAIAEGKVISEGVVPEAIRVGQAMAP